MSEDKPRFHHIRLEGVLFRGAEPVSERLIAFPVIRERGMFGLDAAERTDVDKIVALVKEQGAPVTREIVKQKAGRKHAATVAVINTAIREGRLIELDDGRIAPAVAVPETGNGGEWHVHSRSPERSGMRYDEDAPIQAS